MGYKIHHPIKEKRKTALKIFRGGADDNMCPICLEDFEPSEINTNETIRCESCFQHFHYNCIKHWCESSNEFLSIQNSVCPICRQSNICRNSNFVRRETEAARIRRGIRDNQMETPSEISDIILSIGSEYRIHDNVGLTDLMYLDENWKFNRLNSENENERNENMTNWVSDHLEKFINDMNNSAPNPESQWDIADNREENARTFREEVQRATFNRALPVWFIAPRPEDSLDIQHLRDLHQLKMFTYSEYNRLKRDYPVYSYFELLFSAEKRKINNERRVAKRKLIRISLRIFLYTMILVKKDTVSRGLTVHPVDVLADSSESEYESESETISTQTISTQTQAESETGSQTQEDTPVPEPDDGEVAEPQEGEENVVENDARFDWIPVEENPVEASAVEEAPMARNEAERPRARGWRLPRVQPPGVRVTREPDGTVLFRWRLPRVQPQEEDTPAESTETHVDIVGGAGDLPDDRKELKEMCAKAGLPYSSKEPIERIKKRLTAPRGAAYGGFINSLHELLTNQKYSNIISWENDNDGNFLIVLKDNLLVAKELCPKANSEEGKKKTRYLSRSVQAMKDQFRSYDFNRISNRGENELVFSNPKVKSIDDILTLRGEQSRANQAARRRTRRKARLAVDEQGEPTNRPPRRAASTRLRYVESSSEEESADMAAMAVPRHVLLEHDEQGDLHSVGEESADMADMAAPRHVLLELDEQGDLHSVGEESADVDNNEAANILASITNINDENTEDLDRRTSYLQNLNTNNEHSLKIALLIESLKNHVIDENEQNQIKQKQNELWQGLKEIPMEDEQRRGVLYKYMFEYLKRTIPQAKLNEGAKIAQSNFESIKRAQIHNRPTEPLTEAEQKQDDEEMNAAISRGQMLAQDEDTNMEDVQSDAHLRAALPSSSVVIIRDSRVLGRQVPASPLSSLAPNTQFVEPPSAEALNLREEVAQLMQENEQLKAHKASKTPEAPTEAPKPKRRQLGVVPTPGTRVSVRYQLTPDDQDYEGTVGERLDGRARAMVKFDDGSERPIDFAVPGISITRAPPELAELFDVLEASQSGGAKQADFLINLHKLLTNQEYSNIISWTFDNDGNILILLKDKLLVAKEVCPRSTNIDFHSCARQFCNYGFKTVSRKKIQRIGENELVFSNPKVKSIDDILTLERKISTKCRKSPTIDDGDRVANVLAQLNNPSPQSTDMDNNEAANVLASIANISDENTEDLDRRTTYLQNLNTNNEHSLKIALLIESLKNHVIDENQTNQIKQKQNELWQSLKEIELDNTKRKDILYKYMFEYLKRTIPQAKLNEGAKIAQSNFESIKRAKIHNRPTEPLTESEQKQADEEMNAAISRGQILAQDEDTNMEDVQSPNTQFVEEQEPWWKKSGITDKALLRLHSEPVDGHMIEVWSLDHWKLGRAVRKKGRSQVVLKAPLNSPSSRVAETVRQIVTQVDYIDGTSVDELLHRGDWKQRQNPDYGIKDSENYLLNLGSDNPKYWRYAKSRRSAKSNSGSQSGGVIYVDDENDKMRFECPLSLDIMEDPVIAEDGYSYEKEEIESWIKLSEDKGNPITSPITGDNMGKTLIPNTVLKDIIENSIFDRQHTNQESSSQIEDENKNKGIVIQYKNSKYGFIHTFDGIDNLFFHSSQLDNQIIVGDIVSFVIKEYKGKPTATNIKLIESAWNRKTGVIVKYNNDKQYGFIKSDINGMPEVFVHISEINQLVSVGDKVSFIIGKNMAGKAVAKKVKIINDEIGVEEEKKEDSEIPQLEQRLLMDLIFERDRIMREREKVNSMIKSRK